MTREALSDLLEVVEAAIEAGDWKVDGACEPDLVIRRAKVELEQTQQKPKACKHFTKPLERRLGHLQSKEHQNSFDKREISALKHVLWVVKQPQRTWTGLNDDEQQELYDTWVKNNSGWGLFYSLIETKLKEKNQ